MNNLSIKFKALIGLSLLTVGLGGCSMKAETTAESATKTFHCKDTRDGEEFSFHGSTIKNASSGLFGADSCADVTDDKGKTRQICKSHELWLKCQ